MPDPGNVDPPKRRYKLFKEATMDEGFADQRENQPYIMDLVTLEVLHFQTIPLEIDMGQENSWVVIAAAGRNLPLYQYTGAEDTIRFTLSWYANRQHKEDVMRKIKWIMALSKNNGFDEKPHPIRLVFGNLFKNSKFILNAAPAKISMFDRSKGMMPCLATQEIELKRISINNQLRSEMLDINS